MDASDGYICRIKPLKQQKITMEGVSKFLWYFYSFPYGCVQDEGKIVGIQF